VGFSFIPLTTADQPKPHPNYGRRSGTFDRHVDNYINRARLTPAT
jgi:hypothetical protein